MLIWGHIWLFLGQKSLLFLVWAKFGPDDIITFDGGMHSLAFLTGGFSIAITNYHSGASWNSISSLKCSCSVNLFSLVFFGLFLEFIKRKFHIVWPIVQNGKVQLAWGLAHLVIKKVICRTNLRIKKELEKKKPWFHKAWGWAHLVNWSWLRWSRGLITLSVGGRLNQLFISTNYSTDRGKAHLMPMPYG